MRIWMCMPTSAHPSALPECSLRCPGMLRWVSWPAGRTTHASMACHMACFPTPPHDVMPWLAGLALHVPAKAPSSPSGMAGRCTLAAGNCRRCRAGSREGMCHGTSM